MGVALGDDSQVNTGRDVGLTANNTFTGLEIAMSLGVSRLFLGRKCLTFPNVVERNAVWPHATDKDIGRVNSMGHRGNNLSVEVG